MIKLIENIVKFKKDSKIRKIEQSLINGTKRKDLVCNANTDIVIDGFPRSGNSFLMNLIRVTNKSCGLSISHHTHRPENIRLAIHYSVPTTILIRNPIDSVISYSIYSNYNYERIIKEYINYYKVAFSLKDQINFIVFEELISEPNEVINKININNGMNFKLSSNLEEDMNNVKLRVKKNVQHKNDSITKVGLPSEERNKLKEEKIRVVSEIINKYPKITDIYNKIIEL